MKLFAVSTLTVALVASGCASTERATSWQGRSVSDLTMAWGPPDSLQKADDGRQMLTYSHQHFINGNSYQCRAWFIAEPGGRIAKADVSGNLGGCNTLLRGKPPAN